MMTGIATWRDGSSRLRRAAVSCILATGVIGWAAMLLPAAARAADWPQLLGPERDAVAADNQELDLDWPQKIRPIWRRDVGAGFAGPVVVGDLVLAYHRVGGNDLLEALDFASGRSRWTTEFTAHYGGGINSDNGPRCTPVVDAGQVFLFSASGELFAVDLANGQVQWKRNLYSDYRALEGFFGAGSTPLVWGERVLINVGGRAPNSGIVAVDRRNGKTLWMATQEGASYASPIKSQYEGQPCAVFVTRLSALGLNPQNGESYFSFRFGAPGPTVNGATPVVFDNQLFLSASYNVGSRLVQLGGTAESIWDNDALASQYSTSVYYQGFLYGSHGREDTGRTALRCVDAKTGAIAWSRDDVGVAHVIRLNDQLLVLEVARGTLRRAALDPAAYRELDRTETSGELSRAIPALDRGCLLVRTSGTAGGHLACYQVGSARPPQP